MKQKYDCGLGLWE